MRRYLAQTILLYFFNPRMLRAIMIANPILNAAKPNKLCLCKKWIHFNALLQFKDCFLMLVHREAILCLFPMSQCSLWMKVLMRLKARLKDMIGCLHLLLIWFFDLWEVDLWFWCVCASWCLARTIKVILLILSFYLKLLCAFTLLRTDAHITNLLQFFYTI